VQWGLGKCGGSFNRRSRAESWLVMVESKLFRVPRNGPRETVYLVQINIDLDLSQNPIIRNMFSDPDANKEIANFFRMNTINIENKYEHAGKVSRVELRGSPEGLAKFHEAYLTDDKAGAAYDLQYR
jgi:hypothetical protein